MLDCIFMLELLCIKQIRTPFHLLTGFTTTLSVAE